ncbi:hypothetical protein WN51_11914 [Melipona quadrifasciata]|uniref:Uncharacterized protein n=1 Tax=Melipona quadrifasciata TaxID=166423 RepID=A0A0N0U694_9HYME|nr:hypothetical protein WN51_11914 [Melipona quadrifasciata]
MVVWLNLMQKFANISGNLQNEFVKSVFQFPIEIQAKLRRAFSHISVSYKIGKTIVFLELNNFNNYVLFVLFAVEWHNLMSDMTLTFKTTIILRQPQVVCQRLRRKFLNETFQQRLYARCEETYKMVETVDLKVTYVLSNAERDNLVNPQV